MKEIEKLRKEKEEWKKIAKSNEFRVKELEEELEAISSSITARDKKLTPEIAVAKIKVLVKRFYEDMGREGDYCEIDEERKRIIEEIDDILDKTKIPNKVLILEDFEYDKEKNSEDNKIF